MTANRALGKSEPKPARLKEASDGALSFYLDSMLHEATFKQANQSDVSDDISLIQNEFDEPLPEPKVSSVDEVSTKKRHSEESVKPVLKGKSLSEIKAAARARAESIKPSVTPSLVEMVQTDIESAAEVEISTQTIEPPSLSWKPGEVPEWVGDQFDCLMFDVDGLILGVPMLLLGTLYPIETELTPLFDQADWFKGLMRTADDRNVRIVDTAALVMPDKYDKENMKEYQFAIGIFGTDWAMGAHKIIGSKLIQTEQVKWRAQRKNRSWLAGTIKEEMCAIVDPKAFVDVLLESKSVKVE